MAGTTDRFGLPPPPSGRETARQRLFCQAEVRRSSGLVLGGVFALLKAHLSLDEARRIFDGFAKLGQRKGRGAANPEWNDRLLNLYDLMADLGQDEKSLPRKVAEWVHQSEPEKICHTNGIKATAAQVRHLLAAREQKRVKQDAAMAAALKSLRAARKQNSKTHSATSR